ncbi:MAG: peptidoglycan-binding protein [Aquabacterium sp.]|uniref:CsgG/HfaB family protein n=1 Tax=Aquabacterium sp. TaxID=1872578 RepID=UPI0025BE940C|nr:CsgG/HfaB family protein [Aquabacterium sp.]MBI5926834.1 peptidoglycan-binding protein [Aquabacterium sp.]
MRSDTQDRVMSRWSFSLLTAALASAMLAGCGSTAPTLGENKGVVSGAAGGESAEGQNSQLENCPETLGTLAIEEDTTAPWYYQLRDHQLGSTIPVLRLMIQQSNCFVIVERGKSLNNMMREREFARGDESRAGSNFQKGQMVAADYTMSPAIQFSGKTGGGSAFGGGGALGMLGVIAGSVGRNEASTTLLLIDNRSGVQISAAEGTAKNFDFGMFGAAFGGGGFGGGGGYSKTPQGKVIVAAFADSFNQMVKALRKYKAQTVKGGLGTGGRLGVQGGETAASKELDAKPAPAPSKPAKKK